MTATNTTARRPQVTRVNRANDDQEPTRGIKKRRAEDKAPKTSRKPVETPDDFDDDFAPLTEGDGLEDEDLEPVEPVKPKRDRKANKEERVPRATHGRGKKTDEALDDDFNEDVEPVKPKRDRKPRTETNERRPRSESSDRRPRDEQRLVSNRKLEIIESLKAAVAKNFGPLGERLSNRLHGEVTVRTKHQRDTNLFNVAVMVNFDSGEKLRLKGVLRGGRVGDLSDASWVNTDEQESTLEMLRGDSVDLRRYSKKTLGHMAVTGADILVLLKAFKKEYGAAPVRGSRTTSDPRTTGRTPRATTAGTVDRAALRAARKTARELKAFDLTNIKVEKNGHDPIAVYRTEKAGYAIEKVDGKFVISRCMGEGRSASDLKRVKTCADAETAVEYLESK